MSIMGIKNFATLGLLLPAIVALCRSQEFRDVGVQEHNNYRARHGGPDVSGDDQIHESAQQWADKLAAEDKFEHSGGQHGENIYKAWGGSEDLNEHVKNAVESWYSEISQYNFDDPGFKSSTGHFTQLVWKASTAVGIGAAIAPDQNYGHSVTVVAQYNPAGNVVTDDNSYFIENVVRPE